MLAELKALLTSTTSGKKILAEQERLDRTKREQQLADYAAAKAEREKKVTAALADEEKAKADWEAKRAAYMAADELYATKHRVTNSASWSTDSAVWRIEIQLRASAPPEIDARKAEWEREVVALRTCKDINGAHLLDNVDHTVWTNTGRIMHRESNYQSIQDRATGLRDAIYKAEALKLTDEPDINAALDKLYAAVPAVGKAERDEKKIEALVLEQVNRQAEENRSEAERLRERQRKQNEGPRPWIWEPTTEV